MLKCWFCYMVFLFPILMQRCGYFWNAHFAIFVCTDCMFCIFSPGVVQVSSIPGFGRVSLPRMFTLFWRTSSTWQFCAVVLPVSVMLRLFCGLVSLFIIVLCFVRWMIVGCQCLPACWSAHHCFLFVSRILFRWFLFRSLLETVVKFSDCMKFMELQSSTISPI